MQCAMQITLCMIFSLHSPARLLADIADVHSMHEGEAFRANKRINMCSALIGSWQKNSHQIMYRYIHAS